MDLYVAVALTEQDFDCLVDDLDVEFALDVRLALHWTAEAALAALVEEVKQDLLEAEDGDGAKVEVISIGADDTNTIRLRFTAADGKSSDSWVQYQIRTYALPPRP